MSSPAKNDIIRDVHPYGWTDPNGVFSAIGNGSTRVKFDICPASGNATMLKGFRYCRAWNHTFGQMQARSDGKTYHVDVYAPTFTPQYLYTIPNLDAWMIDTPSLGPTIPGLPGSNMLNATLVSALNKLKAQDIHVGNFLAEADKTMAMFGDATTRIAKGVTKFRKSYPKDWERVKQLETGHLPRNKWCDIPGYWLELQYGWNPLMQDVYGAIHHLTRSNRYKVPYVSVSAHKSDQTTSMTSYSLSTTNFLGQSQSCEVFWDIKLDVWVSLVYGITSPTLAELSSLGLINPLEIVWETTRYSFVVDWFLPVSSWLSALTADVGFTFITGSQSSKATKKFRSSSIVGTPVHNPVVVGTRYMYYGPIAPLAYDGELGVFNRTCYASSPVPGLYVKNPLSLDHVANGMSLLVQAFR